MKSLLSLLGIVLGWLFPTALFGAVPVANPLSVVMLEDKGKVFTVTATDADPGSSLAYQVVDEPTHGKLIGAGPTFIYVPYVNYNGADSFTFTAHDGQNRSALATVSITVMPVEEPAATGPPFAEFVDPNPVPGNQFGATVVALNTGNVVITSPFDDAGGPDAGAVYLFDGATGALISTLRGSTANDQVGSGGVTALSNGNYVVRSQNWDNGTATDAGAVTWGSGSIGVSGAVSDSNSLVGSTSNDQVGGGFVTILNNGNYVVRSPNWDNGAATDAGAVTWGNGSTGISGVVNISNSLVGSTSNDQVGSSVSALRNGNYVVRSTNWDNGAATDAGAVTWGNGSTGISGVVSISNSLVGSTSNDQVGSGGVAALSNGNYVVRSQNWDNGAATDAGAVTWGSGSIGVSGAVGDSNSLVGSTSNDQVGGGFVTALNSGNYVVRSPNWDNGAATDAGAVTWGDGSTGVSGVVTSSNSLVGSTPNDQVGSGFVTALSNGNYVVGSQLWNNGAVTDAGAVTWGNGSTGISGVVSISNSLVGSTSNDQVGSVGAVALSNGNYVVSSRLWNNGAVVDAGAVTWGDGSSGISGVVSISNSLVGSTTNDFVGSGGAVALSNGNYVVRSFHWNNGAVNRVGAVTWGNGNTGISGVVSSSNSLVGSTPLDGVGGLSIAPLSNGNYVVRNSSWNNGAVTDAGAVTWGNGSTGISGVVSSNNSLVGSQLRDAVGSGVVTALSNGNYVAHHNNWDHGALADAGAITWGDGATGISGVVGSGNSLVGSNPNSASATAHVTALTNGNYVVSSSGWNEGESTDSRAVTWGHGTTGISGVVSGANSLIGQSSLDEFAAPVVADEINQTFMGRFPYEGSGRVRVGSQENGGATFPSIASPTSSAITVTTATLGGHVTAAGAAAITERGVVYSLTSVNADPLISGSGVTKVATTGTTGIFTMPIAGLAADSSFSFKAYAINSFSTSYTAVSTFATNTPEELFSNSTAAAGLTGDDALPNATPFGDGLENLLKYAFNMNLAGPDASTLPPGTGTSGLPSITTPEGSPTGTLRFEFLRRKGSGLVYAPQKSTTLDGPSWSPLGAAPVVTAIDEQWERVVYTEAPDPVPAPACFGRVEVLLP